MTKKTLTAKLSPKNLERLENYAEREGISKSEATDRLVKQGLDVEESDMRLVPVKADGGTIIEDQLDEIKRNQDNRLDKIDHKVESLQDEPSHLEEVIDQTVLWSFGFAAIGVIMTLFVGYGLITSLDYDLTTIFTLISSLIYIVSNIVRRSVYRKKGVIA